MTPQPLMPLDRLRAFLQYNPYHFWGMQNAKVPVGSQCNTIVPEYGSQMGYGVGRDEMRRAVAYAEEKLATYLGYDVAPRHRTDILDWPLYGNGQWRNRSNSLGGYLSVTASRGYIQAVGVEKTALIQADVVPVLTKTITPRDSFALTVPTDVTDPNELALYFSASDRYDNSPLGPRWRIAPVDVTIAGGIATISGAAWLLVKPVHFQSFAFTALDPDNNTNFAGTVDVARIYTDSAGTTIDDAQATFIWETAPWPGFCCSASLNSTDPAAVGKVAGRVGIRDAQLGILSAGSAVYADGQWRNTGFAGCADPSRIEVRYRAGLPLVNGEMASFWSDIVCMLTLAELPGPICACKETNQRIAHWQQDLARSSGVEQFAYISGEDLRNPLGTRRGHIEAWKKISTLQLAYGIAV